MFLVGGCVEDADKSRPVASQIEIRDSATELQLEESAEIDLCALASQLDTDNVCSLICDPDAMADFLLAEGMSGGKCVELRCELPGIAPLSVGVCLAP
jgi:hypothetical protein